MKDSDWFALIMLLMVCLVVIFGGYKVFQSGNEVEARKKQALKNRVDFCQSLTVPKESNACLARIALGEN